jgi:NAD(P)-dependent dehydrogenase (short-subunit alcohol dehydrogenase family)
MKQAVVTGAASGIGEACWRDLLGRGWTVYGLDRDSEGLERCSTSVSDTGRFMPITCDVSNAADVERAFTTIAARTPVLNALVCSAGIFRTGPLLAMSERDFDALFAVNTRGAWLSARAAAPLLEKAARGETRSRIIFVASIAAIRPKVGGGAYAASKAALTQIARVLAVELAPRGILVNAIAPATVDTPLTRALAAAAGANGYTLSGTSPLGRVASTADVTPVIRFLLSDESAYVTGVVLPIDGGTSAAYTPAQSNSAEAPAQE